MVIVVAGVKKRGRFAFRFLVSYVARQSGVAAIRVAGGLDPKGSTTDWIRQFEQRASEANCTTAAVHVIVSPTEREATQLGQYGLAKMMNEVAHALDLHDNQRLAAIHVDSTHRHLHAVYSRVRPDLTIVPAERNNHYVLRQLARTWEQRLGTAPPARTSGRLPARASNLEQWTLLPSFTRWSRLAAAHIGLADARTAKEYSEKLARLGVWPELTPFGVVLATMDRTNIVRTKASATGFSPPQDWRFVQPDAAVYRPSAYQRAVETTQTSITLRDPLYSQFLHDREQWVTSGRRRASAIREMLRAERRAFDVDRHEPLPMLSEPQTKIIHLAAKHARGEMLAAHAQVRAEIALARPPSQYGAWLRHRERSGDVTAGLARSAARTTPVSDIAHHASQHSANPITGDAEFDRFVRDQVGAALRLPLARLPRSEAIEHLSRAHAESDVDRERIGTALADLRTSADDEVGLLLETSHTPDDIVRALLEAAQEKRLRQTAHLRELSPPVTTAADPARDDAIKGPERAEQSRPPDIRPSHADEILQAAAGQIRGLDGTRFVSTPPSTKRSRWASRLAEIDAAQRAALTKLRIDDARSDNGFTASLLALQTVVKRARVACEEYPSAMITETLAEAPEPGFTSEGSRFERYRLARAIATIDVVPAANSADGWRAAAFLEDATLPAFFVTDAGYDYGPLTGVHPDSLAAGLLAAERRFGSVHIAGNPAFVNATLAAAAQLGIAVSNAELQPEWRRLHAEFVRADGIHATAITERQRSLTDNERAFFTVFGQPVEVLSAADLTASPVRVTAEVSLRSVLPVTDTQYAVFEAPGGRLQALELHPTLLADDRIRAALASPWWANTLAVSTGAEAAIAIESSPERETSLAQRLSRRKTHARLVLAKQHAIEARAAAIDQERRRAQELDRSAAVAPVPAHRKSSVIDRRVDERAERSM